MKLCFKCTIIIFLISFAISVKANTYAESDDVTYYARVMTENVYLYSTCDQDSQIFAIPKTYFVELFSLNGEYYYARYDDFYGFVKKDEVLPVVKEPQTPFLQNISFRIFVPSGANLRSSPKNDGANNLVCSIPFLDSNISFYGLAQGEEAIAKKGTLWYFCKYYYNNTSCTGYVYAPLCDCLSTIYENNEEIEPLETEPTFKVDVAPTSTDPISEMSQTAQTLIIIAISLPCLLFIYLLFKPTMIAQSEGTSAKNKNNKHKKKISRLKKSDYFEFNDDDLN